MITQYTINCDWTNWNNGGKVQKLTGGKQYTDRKAAEREAKAMQQADKDTGEYNTKFYVEEVK
jgi:hypothetical protein